MDQKSGYGRLFPNQRDDNPKRPSFSGPACCPNCHSQIRIAAWNKEDGYSLKLSADDRPRPASTLTPQQQQWEREGKSIFTGIPQRKDKGEYSF